MKLPILHNQFEMIKEVNQYWKNSGILIDLLNDTAKQLKQKTVALQLPGRTRWQGKLYTTQSNLTNQIYMQRAILDEKASLSEKSKTEAKEKYQKMRKIILDEAY